MNASRLVVEPVSTERQSHADKARQPTRTATLLLSMLHMVRTVRLWKDATASFCGNAAAVVDTGGRCGRGCASVTCDETKARPDIIPVPGI